MKIGLIGYQGSGKSTLFEWLTGVAPDPALSHTTQSAMAPLADKRVAALAEVYHPKKITLASLQLIDTPGLSRTHEKSAARLGMIREAGCLVVVVAAFDGSDPLADLVNFEEDLLLADLEIVTRRVERLRESVKKPRPTREQEMAELAALEPLLTALEAGRSPGEAELADEQLNMTRSFQLFSGKPRLIVVNVGDDEQDPKRFFRSTTGPVTALAVPLGLAVELERLSAADRAEMIEDLGLVIYPRDRLLEAMLAASGQMCFFTASEKEVRTWLLRRGGTALEAADGIHSDLARGFIRAETMCCDDLVRLGSERELKAQNLVRSEPKNYVVQEGDILHIRFSV